MPLVHTILLAFAFLTALTLGASHLPITIALGGACLSAAVSWLGGEGGPLALPWWVLSVVAFAPAALVAGAAWGTARPAWTSLGFGIAAFLVLLEGLGLVQWARLGISRAQLGDAYALAWLVAIWIGVLGLRRPRGARAARFAIVALLTGLIPEGIAWIAWGHDVEGAFFLASMVSSMSLLVVCAVQFRERCRSWRSPRTSSSASPSERLSGWPSRRSQDSPATTGSTGSSEPLRV
jgi:hypothetical protein